MSKHCKKVNKCPTRTQRDIYFFFYYKGKEKLNDNDTSLHNSKKFDYTEDERDNKCRKRYRTDEILNNLVRK